MHLLGDAVLARCGSIKLECEPRRDHRVQAHETRTSVTLDFSARVLLKCSFMHLSPLLVVAP